MTPGLYLVHKPVSAMSFSVVQALLDEQGATPGKRWKMCHGGALDPFASGLMLVLVGPATKLFHHLHAVPKKYRARVRWGVETHNFDPTGRVVSRGDASPLTPALLDAALARLVGWSEQVPPNTSNKRVGGERAWAKAQRGEAFELPPSRVYLHHARWLSHRLPESSELELTCRGGFYVRALARDLGRALGCFAHLETLERLEIGPWKDPGEGQQRRCAASHELLGWCPSRVLSDDEWGAIRRGEGIAAGQLVAPALALEHWPEGAVPIRGIHRDRFIAVLKREYEQLLTFSLLEPGL